MVGNSLLHPAQVGGDEDLEMMSSVVSLRCPLTGSRIRTPARFSDVRGISAFDLDAFFAMMQRNRKWQCPHSMQHSTVRRLQIDAFTSAILARLKARPPYLMAVIMYISDFQCCSRSWQVCVSSDMMPVQGVISSLPSS